tara:strand:- start:19883 stop:20728 length:846 start_codon:yes stop_codon:yes gene_type:complete
MRKLIGVVSILGVSVFLFVHAGHTTGSIVTEGMVLIPEGEFLMGSSGDEVEALKDTFGKKEMYKDYPFEAETPKRKVFVKSFYIDRHEVTNKEYMQFIRATGHNTPRHWEGARFKSGKKDFPVLFVSQIDAAAYAKWKGKRLPTEEEWEKAARGTDGRVFPWGDSFDPYKAVTAESDMQFLLKALSSIFYANKVELAQGDSSPYGVHDMAGNVREWTSTAAPDTPSMLIVKGGSWVDLSINARTAHREYIPKNAVSHIIGFRCVKDVDIKIAGVLTHEKRG